MGKTHAAALARAAPQRRVALHAGARDRHRVAPAHEVDALHAAAQVGVRGLQFLQHALAQGAASPASKRGRSPAGSAW